MLSLTLFVLCLMAIAYTSNNSTGSNSLPCYALIVPKSFDRYIHGNIVPSLPRPHSHTTLPKAPRAFMKACDQISGVKPSTTVDKPKEPSMQNNDFWTDEQLKALESMDKYCSGLRKAKEVVGMPAEIFMLKKEIADLLAKSKLQPINPDKALSDQDEYIANLMERESQRQHFRTDYRHNEYNDFPMDRADRLMFGRVDDACPELCKTIFESTLEHQTWSLAEVRPVSEAEQLARKLEAEGHTDEAKWVREHSDVWETTTDKLPIYKFRKEYLRIRQGKLEFIPGKLELRGFEEAEPAYPVRWVKVEGLALWPRLANRPIRLSLGANLLVAMVRCKLINDQVTFNKLISNIDDIDSNTRNRMWSWFEFVMFKRNPEQYKTWKSRQKSRNLQAKQSV